MISDNTYIIYTDGGCRGNPGKGGWGFHMIKPDKEILEKKGFDKKTTNNIMELTAAIEGLMNIPDNSNVVLYTDSSYVKNGINSWINNWVKNGWKTANGKPVKNKLYWLTLYNLTKKHNIEFKWVKAHANIYGNERADTLANEAMNAMC